MQDDVRSAEESPHLAEDRKAAAAAVASIGIDLPRLSERDLVHLLTQVVGGRPCIAPLNQLGVEAFGKEDHFLPPGDHAQRARQQAQEPDFALGTGAVELFVEALLAAGDVFLKLRDGVRVWQVRQGLRLKLESLRAGDLQRVARSERQRIGDRLDEQAAISGERRQ